MRDVRFSNDGTKVYGTVDSKTVVIDVPFTELGIGDDSKDFPGTDLTVCNRPGKQVSAFSRSVLMSLSDGSSPKSQQSNSMIFSRDQDGRAVVTDLQQSVDAGALVLRTLRDDQTMTQETLTRLPDWVDRHTEATLLQRHAPGDDKNEAVRVVLNKASRPFQTFSPNDQKIVPTILEREEQTIPKFVSTGVRQIEGAGEKHKDTSFEDDVPAPLEGNQQIISNLVSTGTGKIEDGVVEYKVAGLGNYVPPTQQRKPPNFVGTPIGKRRQNLLKLKNIQFGDYVEE
jgi:hypothetical protein